MREFKPALKIGDGPWFTPGPVPRCKTYRNARAIGAMFAKWWLGVAESDVESDGIDKRESLRKLVLAKRSRKAEHLNSKEEESYVQPAIL